MKPLRLILLLAYFTASVPGVDCQTVFDSAKAKTRNPQTESSIDNARFNQLAQEVATAVFSFNDQRVKTWAISQLAEAFWAHDEHAAREFMQKALDTCSQNSSQSKSEREELLWRRRTLIAIIFNYDDTWAENLIKDDPDFTAPGKPLPVDTEPSAVAPDQSQPRADDSSSEKSADVAQGEDALLVAFSGQFLQGNYVAAQKVLDRVSTPGLHDGLQRVLSFRQIADELEKGVPPATIKPSISKLPRNVESALLWSGLANAYLRQGKPDAARDSLLSAVIAISDVKDYRKPYLHLHVAKIYAEFNPQLADLMFKEAVKYFNALENDPPPVITWHSKVQATQLSREFPLRLKGLIEDIGQVVLKLARAENSDVYSLMLTLKDETLKAKSLLSYLRSQKSRLDSAPR